MTASTGLQALITAAISGTYTGPEAIGSLADAFNENIQISLSTGAGANGADTVWKSNRTLGASTSENLDLNGVLTDVFGNTVNFVRIKALLIKANPANTNNVVFGAAASDPFVNLLNSTGTVSLPPGAVALFATPDPTGWVITPATGDLLKVANSAGTTSVNYDIVVLGAAE